MEIFWTMLASQDRKRIREYIAEQNLMAVIELDERIGYSASSLAGQPYKGRNGRMEGTRGLVIHSRHTDDTVVLLRIHHIIGELPTYGYRRVWALLRRQAELDGMPAINAKRENLAEAFEHYNEWHPHSALGYRSPREYLRQQASNGLSDNRCLEI